MKDLFKVYIHGFWGGFDYKVFPIYGLLEKYFPSIEVVTNPNDEFDLCLSSVFCEHTRPVFLQDKFCIQYSGESKENYGRFEWGDYHIGFQLDSSNNLHFPIWKISLIDYFNKTFSIREDPRPLVKKSRYCGVFASHDPKGSRARLWNVMQSFGPIDSYGYWRRNCIPDNKLYTNDQIRGQSKMSILDHYLFNICSENTIEDYYLTEKLPEAMLANTIPIYIGDPKISESILNPKRFINATYMSDSDLVKEISSINLDSFLREPVFTEPLFKNGIEERAYKLIDRIQEEF